MKRLFLAGLLSLLVGCIEAPPAAPSDPSPDVSQPEPDASMPDPIDMGTSEPDGVVSFDMDVDVEMDIPDPPDLPVDVKAQFRAISSHGDVQNLPLFVDYTDTKFLNWSDIWISGATEVERHYPIQTRVEFWAHFAEIGSAPTSETFQFTNIRNSVLQTPWNDFHAVWHMRANALEDVVGRNKLIGLDCTNCRTNTNFLGVAMKTNQSTFALDDAANIVLDDDWSVTFWVKFDEVNDGSFHVLTLQTDDLSIEFERRANLLFVSGESQEETAVPVVVDTWYFIAVNSLGQIYVDGVDTWVLPTRLSGTLSISLGDVASDTAYDELWVAKRSFSPVEATTLYKNQNRELQVSVEALDP